jgi:hypothetical protein
MWQQVQYQEAYLWSATIMLANLVLGTLVHFAKDNFHILMIWRSSRLL